MKRCALLLLVSSCYNPKLPAVPFSCPSNSSCPDGYHCAQSEQICIADGKSDQRFLLADGTGASAPPQPVWNSASQRFGIFWIQNPLDATRSSGLWLTELEGEKQLGPYQIESTKKDTISFDALYHPGSSAYVVAEAWKGESDTQLRVKHFASPDLDTAPDAELSSDTLFEDPHHDPAAVGFSTPSLALGSQSGVTLAYTLGDPPSISQDNVYCVHLLNSGSAPDCNPVLSGKFATQVLVAVPDETATTLFWRDGGGSVFETAGGTNDQIMLTGIHDVSRVATSKGQIALVEQQGTSDSPAWTVSAIDQSPLTGIPSSDVVPDLIATDVGLAVCAFDSTDGLFVYVFDSAVEAGRLTLSAHGSLTSVPRESTANISSCRLAYSPETKQVAVAWQESVPPSLFRNYVMLLTPK